MLIASILLFLLGLSFFILGFFMPDTWTVKLSIAIPVLVCWSKATMFGLPVILSKGCTEFTQGTIEFIKANGVSVGGHHQPLYKARIHYLGRSKIFNNLPPNFIHDFRAGDVIPIKYNPKRPKIAYVNFENYP